MRCRSHDSIDDNGIGVVLIHPPFDQSYNCSEHYEGQLPALGDSLGTDCSIGKLVEIDDRLWMREYDSDGLQNTDWYGYGADVLAPCDCRVVDIRINGAENEPGKLGEPPASWITFERDDATRILLAHVKDVRVAVGDDVEAGAVIAAVGNNGYSRQPHIHIGAWRGETPLQLRFDQTRMQPVDRSTPQ